MSEPTHEQIVAWEREWWRGEHALGEFMHVHIAKQAYRAGLTDAGQIAIECGGTEMSSTQRICLDVAHKILNSRQP